MAFAYSRPTPLVKGPTFDIVKPEVKAKEYGRLSYFIAKLKHKRGKGPNPDYFDPNGHLICPKCGQSEDGWLEGPSGGMTVNIKCGGCGQKYNYNPPGGLLGGGSQDQPNYMEEIG